MFRGFIACNFKLSEYIEVIAIAKLDKKKNSKTYLERIFINVSD